MAELVERLENFEDKDGNVNSSLLDGIVIDNKLTDFIRRKQKQQRSGHAAENTLLPDFKQIKEEFLAMHKAQFDSLNNQRELESAETLIIEAEKINYKEMDENFSYLNNQIKKLEDYIKDKQIERESKIQQSLNDMMKRHVEGEKYIFARISDLTSELKAKLEIKNARSKIEPELEKKILQVRENILKTQGNIGNSERLETVEGFKKFAKKMEEVQGESLDILKAKTMGLEVMDVEGSDEPYELFKQSQAIEGVFNSIKSGLEQMKEVFIKYSVY